MFVKGLSKTYEPSPLWLRFLLRSAITEPVVALQSVSLSVARGTICAVVGPNGAGKSTLFRILTGLTTPTEGRVYVSGIDVAADALEARRRIGFLPAGDQSLYLRLTCIENLMFHGRLQGLSGNGLRARISSVLEQVGLGAVGSRAGFALSAGMRARLQLARALLNQPGLLILDEPTATVDPVGSYELLELIQQVVKDGAISVLLSSHRLEEIEALHDQVAIMDRGAVIYKGDLDTFRNQYSKTRIELSFASHVHTLRAREILSFRPGVKVSMDDAGKTLAVMTDRPVGSVLSLLGPMIDSIVDVTKTSPQFREILQNVLTPGPSA